MRKTILVPVMLVLALALWFAVPASAHPVADEASHGTALQWTPPSAHQTGLYVERGNVGFFLGYPLTVDDELDADGLVFGVSGSYNFLPYLGIEVAGTRQNLHFLPAVVFGTEPPLSNGTIESFVLSTSALFRATAGSRVALYSSVGVAYFINDFKVDSAAADDLAEFGFLVGDNVENALGLNLAGGVNILVWRSFGVFTEVRYLRATADTTARITDEVTQISESFASSQRLQSIIWSGGIRFYF